MKITSLFLFLASYFLCSSAYCEEGYWDVLKIEEVQQDNKFSSEERKLRARVQMVYQNYSQAHPNCNYQANPNVYVYPATTYILSNPYIPTGKERMAFKFKIRNFVIDSPPSDQVNDPYCGKVSIKCASYDEPFLKFNYYCERIHDGKVSDPARLSDPRYNKYLAYQTIYNLTVMPTALKNFGLLQQFYPLEAFPPYSSAQTPNPDYEYPAVVYSTFNYPDPTVPPSPNYSNGNYGFLFLGSAENLKSLCYSIKRSNLSLEDAGVRINEFFGLPPDSPDVQRAFTFFKLRNNPHLSGVQDGNMFRPCAVNSSIETLSCPVSALEIAHNCKNPPPAPYDGTTLSSFLTNQFYSAYCSKTPSKDSGQPIHYPWTGQGFTYDWYPWPIYPINVQGNSEYVPATNSGGFNIEVTDKKTLADFLMTCDFD
ncbi:hypothetical protein [Legionella sp. 227]|uniref:hypothetical protein n=1 Tax=Legionella sp. 227 TaxID=3367288 RepID=UPI00370D86AB